MPFNSFIRLIITLLLDVFKAIREKSEEYAKIVPYIPKFSVDNTFVKIINVENETINLKKSEKITLKKFCNNLIFCFKYNFDKI